MGETTYGGFFKQNIRRFLLKEMLESGNPMEMFRAIRESIEDIEDELFDIDEEDDME